MAEAIQRCVVCAMEFGADMPEAEFINQMTVSMVVFAHPQMIACPKCGQTYIFRVRSMGKVMMGYEKFDLPNQEKKSDILIPGGVDFSHLKQKQ